MSSKNHNTNPHFIAELQAGTIYLTENDPILNKYIEIIGACDLRPAKDPFANLIHSIIGQQLSVKAANTIIGRFNNLINSYYVPSKLMEISVERIRGCGLSNSKSQYVKNIAEHKLNNEELWKEWVNLSNQEVYQELIQIKGVGPWTIDMFLIFSLGRLNVLPLGDLGLQNIVKKIYGDDQNLKDAALNWGNYSSIASWYLWKVLDDGMGLVSLS